MPDGSDGWEQDTSSLTSCTLLHVVLKPRHGKPLSCQPTSQWSSISVFPLIQGITTSSEKYSSPKTEEAVADLPPSAKWTLLHSLHFWLLCSPLCLSLLHPGWVLRDSNQFLLFHMSCHGSDTCMSPADKKQSPHQTCCSSPAIPGQWAWYLQVPSRARDTWVWGKWIHPLQPGQLEQLWESHSLLLTSEHCKCGRRGIKLQ